MDAPVDLTDSVTSRHRGHTAACRGSNWPNCGGYWTTGAGAFGFLGAIWTSSRVAAVIKRWFGVTYYRSHVGRLLWN